MAKTVLITGASSGIGRAAAVYFADKGWKVVATMRRPEQEDTLQQHNNITLLRLDVLDEASITAAVTSAIQTFGKIDVLINNAGYGAVGAFEAASQEQIKRQFDTNVFGLMNVTRALLPHFRQQKAGIIMNVASVGGRITFPLYSLYHGTKWAVEGFSESLHYELKPHNIQVKIIEPGAIKTDFYDRSQDLFRKEGLTAYDAYQQLALPNMQAVGAKAPGPEIVAKTMYKASTDGSSKLRYPVGSGAPALLFLRRIIPNKWFYGIVRSVVEKKS
ncbi:MAG: SDR family oxidoreductase [Hymenobacteraceae bacterium]|nr:SDR family oxidoreductase [Hymenobacteraceae bacterium]MDX5396126.1 SDR family oxidoreductase [Hymenobacteraceae bacterium]MDX5442812.1 SDR family oxidoreductase [Hymenobacteraceae bacterium]MDX5512187.1 SDR family oxidoreductase [Hymenobacteraceae bacterium]